MRALGFCVSIYTRSIWPGSSQAPACLPRGLGPARPIDERRRALGSVARKAICAVFSVDVLGEGVDVRTSTRSSCFVQLKSATLFASSWARPSAERRQTASTVIDLIGQQHRHFRFEDKLRAVIDERQGPVREQVQEHYPSCRQDAPSSSIVKRVKSCWRISDGPRPKRSGGRSSRNCGDAVTWACLRGTRRLDDASPTFTGRRSRGWTRLRRDAALAMRESPTRTRTPCSTQSVDSTTSTTRNGWSSTSTFLSARQRPRR